MAVVADSGAVYAIYDRRDSFHERVRAAVEKLDEPIVIPAPALGEIDYLLRARIGNEALLRFLDDIHEGAFRIEHVTPDDLRRCAALVRKYTDIDLGLANASIAAVAERIGTDKILTVDARDFGLLRSSKGKAFRLLPSTRLH